MNVKLNDTALLLDVKTVAKLCGISRSTLYKLHSAGKCPKAIKLGRSSRWRAYEIYRWIDSGCPPYDKWK